MYFFNSIQRFIGYNSYLKILHDVGPKIAKRVKLLKLELFNEFKISHDVTEM